VKSNLQTIPLSDEFIAAVLGQERVSGVPHEIYRYPARFSPPFAREAILSFTAPGDLVLDPFCGGGTSVTEAIALARRAGGMDISSLATFLTRAKTTPLSVHDVREITTWWAACARSSRQRQVAKNDSAIVGGSYERYLPPHISEFFASILARVPILPKIRQQNFVRLILLSLGQWALDCKTRVPRVLELEREFHKRLLDITQQFRGFLTEAAGSNRIPRCRLTRMRRIVGRSCAGCEIDKRIPTNWLPAKLVLTSPPYPGVHVLYHRWQIHGRRESPLPFLIANQRDGAGESHYTFGWRNQAGLKTYFATLRSTFVSIRALLDQSSLVVQLVGFSDPEWQLPRYLQTMQEAGFREIMAECHRHFLFSGRVWRNVPSRRWYARTNATAKSSHEVLLFRRTG
jgi:hypothetical protein